MKKNEDIEHIIKDGPTLFSLEEKGEFIPPEGFFDHFPHNVQDAVKGVHSGIQMPFWKGMVIALPLIAVLVAVSGILIRMTSESDVQAFSGVDHYDIEEVLEYEDAEYLIADISVEDLPSEMFTDIDEEMLEEDIELEYLIEEL